MTVRFFILQSHYRSPLDFSSEALVSSEKAFKRLWEAYSILQKLEATNTYASDDELDKKVNDFVLSFEEDMNDDLSCAKVIASMFELVPIINGIKGGQVATDALSSATLARLKEQMHLFIENVFGLQGDAAQDNGKLDGVLQLLINMRKEAKGRKDFATSDKIRDELQALGVQLKDEKGGEMSYTFA
jgi:cysteinyl-tRNA synthetase